MYQVLVLTAAGYIEISHSFYEFELAQKEYEFYKKKFNINGDEIVNKDGRSCDTNTYCIHLIYP
jgi:hypothetical protein